MRWPRSQARFKTNPFRVSGSVPACEFNALLIWVELSVWLSRLLAIAILPLFSFFAVALGCSIGSDLRKHCSCSAHEIPEMGDDVPRGGAGFCSSHNPFMHAVKR